MSPCINQSPLHHLHRHGHHLALQERSASGRSRPPQNGSGACLTDTLVRLTALLVWILAERPSSLLLSTANQQQTAKAQRSHGSKYTTMSWSSGKWQEASGIKYRLHKTNLWLDRKPGFKDALQDTHCFICRAHPTQDAA